MLPSVATGTPGGITGSSGGQGGQPPVETADGRFLEPSSHVHSVREFLLTSVKAMHRERDGSGALGVVYQMRHRGGLSRLDALRLTPEDVARIDSLAKSWQ